MGLLGFIGRVLTVWGAFGVVLIAVVVGYTFNYLLVAAAIGVMIAMLLHMFTPSSVWLGVSKTTIGMGVFLIGCWLAWKVDWIVLTVALPISALIICVTLHRVHSLLGKP